ncbi:lactonase family protein [Phytohalomonas tamaricis]|uniref:lactonase family protein n=1 Tax=Phytohalomonas tamaricis TaxID=2081032 RepID=UPI0021D452D2|nr:lactonase family protein [Phytohalomonas tamaricis]
MNECHLLVGTYTQGQSEGIHRYRFEATTGRCEEKGVTTTPSPSYLAIAHDQRFVFAVNEIGSDRPGEVSAFRFYPRTGELTFINKVSSQGADPCYVSVSPDGRYLFIANYSGGSLAVIPVDESGRLDKAVQVIEFGGGSRVDPERQEAAHIHSTVVSPDSKYLFVGDLGNDKLYRFTITDDVRQPLHEESAVHLPVDPGKGPRLMHFSPDGRFAYLIGELDGDIDVLAYANGELEKVQSVNMAPKGVHTLKHGGAEVQMSPDGRFLYASNRGSQNEIVIYAVNAENGMLTLQGHESTRGETPRHFTLDPSGRFLLVGNQDSGHIAVFKRDINSGLLQKTPEIIELDDPAFLLMVPVAG